jgi:hypothetical protein
MLPNTAPIIHSLRSEGGGEKVVFTDAVVGVFRGTEEVKEIGVDDMEVSSAVLTVIGREKDVVTEDSVVRSGGVCRVDVSGSTVNGFTVDGTKELVAVDTATGDVVDGMSEVRT